MACHSMKLKASAIRTVSLARSPLRGWRLGAALAAAVFFAAPAGAQEGISPPVALEQSQPAPPKGQFGIPLEGWVKVRYSVLADGSVANARAVEAMPPTLQTKDAVAAVSRWKFTPAKAGGEAIEWHNNESAIVFDLEEVPLEPSPFFSQSYAEIIELIDAQNFDKARKQNQMLGNRVTRLAEIGLIRAQAAVINVQTANHHDAYEAILQATDPNIPTLAADYLPDALRYRFALAAQLGHYADSLASYDRLVELEALEDNDPVSEQAAAIRSALQTDAAIVVQGRVVRDPWRYAPTRKTFGFAEVSGTVRGLELECNRRKTALEFALDVEWSIPASWGACTLLVDARKDTTFSLVEFPPGGAAGAAAQ